jgi:predicted AlkP superfamily phosphohydrolase/phosphomutase
VIFVSHYGMHSQYPTGPLLNDFVRQLGYFTPTAPVARPPRTPLELARRLLPERLRRALSHRLSTTTQERLLRDQFAAGADWTQTTAFAHLDYFTGLIQVNLRGREPEGVVAPADYPSVLDRLEADLRQLVDPVTGQSPFRQILRTLDVYGGPPSAYLPDLFVHWRSVPHFVARLDHPRAILTQPRPHYFRNSGHYFEGLAVFAGPAVTRQGDLGDLSLLDVAPTCLNLLGAPAPAAWPGRALRAVGGL